MEQLQTQNPNSGTFPARAPKKRHRCRQIQRRKKEKVSSLSPLASDALSSTQKPPTEEKRAKSGKGDGAWLRNCSGRKGNIIKNPDTLEHQVACLAGEGRNIRTKKRIIRSAA